MSSKNKILILSISCQLQTEVDRTELELSLLPLSIKFVCCSVQNYIYSSKSKLVGSGLFITESVKRKELHFLKVGQQEFQVQNIWSLKGSIFVHIKGEKMIKTMVTKDDNNTFFPYYF